MRIVVDDSLPDLTPKQISAAIKRGNKGLKKPETVARVAFGDTAFVIRPQVAKMLAALGVTEDMIFEELIRRIGTPPPMTKVQV